MINNPKNKDNQSKGGRDTTYTTRILPHTSTPFLLYILGLPLIPATIGALWQGHTRAGLAGIIGCVLLFIAASLVKRGLRMERINTVRRWHRRTRVPWKLIGAGLTGWAVSLLANTMVGANVGSAILLGILASIGCVLRYGLDAKFSQQDTVLHYGMTVDEIVTLTDEARENIYSLEQATVQIRAPRLKQKLRTITQRAREIVDELEIDPTQLRKARKFLKVYLEGATSVAQKYAAQGQLADDDALDANFTRVLDTIDATFDEQLARLQQHDVLNLDVQIEVLEQQMKMEGLR